VPVYLLADSAAIVMYVASFTMSLVGPTSGEWLMLPAFYTTVVVSMAVGHHWRKGTLPRASAAVRRFFPDRRIIAAIAFGMCGVAVASMLGCAATSIIDRGVPDGDGPLLATQSEYRLNNHGDIVLVSRFLYIAVGLSGHLAWHCLGLTFAFVSLHVLLFGFLPTQCPSD
jgi:hypothetical protein